MDDDKKFISEILHLNCDNNSYKIVKDPLKISKMGVHLTQTVS